MSYRVRLQERDRNVSVVWEADTFASMPPATISSSGDKCITLDDGALWLRDGREWVNVTGSVGGAAAWGSITGTLSAQTDLQSALDLKSASVHTHVESDITGLVSDLALKAPLASPAFTGTPTGITKSHVGLGSVDNTSDAGKPVSTAQQTALDLKQNLDSDLTTIAGLTATTDNVIQSVASAWASRTPAQLKTSMSFVKGDVGLGSVDNTADTAKPISTATQTALDGKQPLDADLTTIAGLTATTDNFIVSVASAWASRTVVQVKTTLALNNVDNTTDANKPISTATQTVLTAMYGVWRMILQAEGSHTAAKVAGTYAIPAGDVLAVSGTGTLYPLALIKIDSADYPTINGIAPKFRVKGVINVNDVAPTGNFTVGLHAVTRPATSGGAGLNIFTMAAAIASSSFTVTTPAADSQTSGVSADFALPADGFYVLGCVTTATIAASSHVHVNAHLDTRNA